MTENEFFDHLLETYNSEFERGEYTGAVKAVMLCAMNNLPMPDWVGSEASKAIDFYFKNGGAHGRGKTGGHLVQYKRDKLHRRRHHIAEWELAKRKSVGGNRQQAFERASERLAGTFARGSHEEIERSFNKINRALKSTALQNPN